MSLFLANKIKGGNNSEFERKVIAIANQLGIKPNWLMIVMNFESGLNSKAVNATSGATGLIQFMPATAQGLGTTTEELKNMTNIRQLDFVYSYLARYAGKIHSLTDLYLCIFYPNAVGKENTYILGKRTNGVLDQNNANLIARQNRIFDTNNDGFVTKSEVERYITSYANKLGYSTTLDFGIEKKK